MVKKLDVRQESNKGYWGMTSNLSIIAADSKRYDALQAILKETGLWLLLFAVLVTRGFMPVGTMPNAPGQGLPWVLCPSDASSALLIELFPTPAQAQARALTNQHHVQAHGPESLQDEASAASLSADQVCKFSALGTLASHDVSLTLPDPVFTGHRLTVWFYRRFAHTPEHQRPFLRGPPSPFFV